MAVMHVPALCATCSEAQQSTRNVVSRLRTGFRLACRRRCRSLTLPNITILTLQPNQTGGSWRVCRDCAPGEPIAMEQVGRSALDDVVACCRHASQGDVSTPKGLA